VTAIAIANSTDESGELPFMRGVTKSERKRLETVLDKWEEAKEVMRAKGAYVPVTFAAAMCNVSSSRMYDLCREGKVELVALGSHKFVTESSLFAWRNSQRQNGRPFVKAAGDCVRSFGDWLGDRENKGVGK
jgi:hypothetical protein